MKISPADVKKAQQEDEDIGKMISRVKDGVTKSEVSDSKTLKLLIQERTRLFLDKDKCLRRTNGNHNQLVVPAKLRSIVYKYMHNEMGHLGAEWVFQLTRKRFYWPYMHTDIKHYIDKECKCIIQKRPHHHEYAPLQRIVTSAPMDLVGIDFVHLEKSSGGHEYILVIVDYFTKYAQAYATRNKSALTAARCLYGDFILRYGIPGKIHHDQGGEFENHLFTNLEKLCGVTKSRTTAYHPQGNGTVERMNKTLLQMLRTLPELQKRKWHEGLNKVLFAYNATRHDVTGYSPHFLMFGREPVLPIDVVLNSENELDIPKSYPQYVKDWKNQMTEAFQIAFEKSEKNKERNRLRFLQKPQLSTLKIGDRVLVKNVVERGGPGKLRSYWEQEIYKIVGVKDSPDYQIPVVYDIRKESDPKSKIRTVHRNLLMYCGELMMPQKNESCPPSTSKKMKTRSDHKKEKVDSPPEEKERNISDTADSEEDEWYFNNDFRSRGVSWWQKDISKTEVQEEDNDIEKSKMETDNAIYDSDKFEDQNTCISDRMRSRIEDRTNTDTINENHEDSEIETISESSRYDETDSCTTEDQMNFMNEEIAERSLYNEQDDRENDNDDSDDKHSYITNSNTIEDQDNCSQEEINEQLSEPDEIDTAEEHIEKEDSDESVAEHFQSETRRRRPPPKFTYDTLGSPVMVRTIQTDSVLNGWQRGWRQGWQSALQAANAHGLEYDEDWLAGWRAGWQVAAHWQTSSTASNYAVTTYL